MDFAQAGFGIVGKNFKVLDDAAECLDFDLCSAGPLAGNNGTSFNPQHLQHLGNLTPSNLQEYYEKAAFFASSSLYEPFGLAVLEAAGHGTPLVLSDIPTFRELWDGAAYFVEENTASAWSRALQDLMNSPEQRTALGQQALSRSISYSVENMVAKTHALHARLNAAKVCAA